MALGIVRPERDGSIAPAYRLVELSSEIERDDGAEMRGGIERVELEDSGGQGDGFVEPSERREIQLPVVGVEAQEGGVQLEPVGEQPRCALPIPFEVEGSLGEPKVGAGDGWI